MIKYNIILFPVRNTTIENIIAVKLPLVINTKNIILSPNIIKFTTAVNNDTTIRHSTPSKKSLCDIIL